MRKLEYVRKNRGVNKHSMTARISAVRDWQDPGAARLFESTRNHDRARIGRYARPGVPENRLNGGRKALLVMDDGTNAVIISNFARFRKPARSPLLPISRAFWAAGRGSPGRREWGSPRPGDAITLQQRPYAALFTPRSAICVSL
jgi:hypothetical protein